MQILSFWWSRTVFNNPRVLFRVFETAAWSEDEKQLKLEAVSTSVCERRAEAKRNVLAKDLNQTPLFNNPNRPSSHYRCHADFTCHEQFAS